MSSYKKVSLDREQAQTLLNMLKAAFETVARVKKIRRLFLVGQSRVHVDSVEGLGDFVELEVCRYIIQFQTFIFENRCIRGLTMKFLNIQVDETGDWERDYAQNV